MPRGKRAPIHGWNVQEKKVASTDIIQHLHQALIYGENLVVETLGRSSSLAVRVSYIIDADEDAEDCVLGLPGAGTIDGKELVLDLLRYG